MIESAQSFWSSKSKGGGNQPGNTPSQTLDQMEREINAAAQKPPLVHKEEESIRNLEKEFEDVVEVAPK